MKDAKCKKCGKPAVVKFRTYRISLCEACLPAFYESLVERSVKRHRILRENERVLVAVSGGKDSVALASTLKNLASKLNLSLEIIHINLGIGEYSEKSEEVVRKLAEMLEIPLQVEHLSDFGFTIPAVRMRKVCSACGTAKRYLMNRYARLHRFDVVATGHTCDDFAAFALKNIAGGNLEWLLKFQPRAEGFAEGVVTKVRPLFERTEEENLLYVKAKKLPFLADKCPFSPPKDEWKEIVREIERKKAGFMRNFVRGIAKIAAASGESVASVKYCKICGEIASSDVCAFCKLRLRSVVAESENEMQRQTKRKHAT